MSKAIVNQLEASSPYKVVSREYADTILEGEILDIHLRTLTTGTGSLPQEQLYIVRLNFTWKDLRTGKILVERRRFEQSSTYFPTLGEGEFIGSQQNVEKLATSIIQELQADWSSAPHRPQRTAPSPPCLHAQRNKRTSPAPGGARSIE